MTYANFFYGCTFFRVELAKYVNVTLVRDKLRFFQPSKHSTADPSDTKTLIIIMSNDHCRDFPELENTCKYL